MAFKRAVKKNLYARIALIGVSGGGKTYTGLQIAKHLAGNKRVAVIDTEHGSASKYADLFNFDVIELTSFAPRLYRDAIYDAVKAGYGCILIDSLSHAWMGKDGVLEYKDIVAARAGKNNYTAWREAGSEQTELVETILAAKIHIVVTMRSKMEYVQEKDERGNTQIRKIGLQPVQRDGMEYEFDLIADMSEGKLIVDKTRCSKLDGKAFNRDGEACARIFLDWLTNGLATPCEAIGIDPVAQAERADAAGQTPPEAVAQVQECVDVEMDALRDQFKAACQTAGLNPRTEATKLCKYHGASDWASLMPAQIRAAIAAMQPVQTAGDLF